MDLAASPENEVSAFAPRPVTAYVAVLVAWLVACLARITLIQPEMVHWLAPTVALAGCAVGLLVTAFSGHWRVHRGLWLLSVALLSVPLFLLRDWLTQTTYMWCVAALGVWAGRPGKPEEFLTFVRVLTVILYAFALFHKLNSGFFDVEISCANYGWEKLARAVGAAGSATAVEQALWVPHVVLLSELIIPILLMVRPRHALAFGGLFHLPLTLVLAPAFAFVMLCGYAAALDDNFWRDKRAAVRALSVSAASAGLLWLAIGPGVWDWVFAVKAAVLVGLSAFALLRGGTHSRKRVWSIPSAVFLAAFSVHALTPYARTQTQHTGAMLSNLRIDEGCWNHLLVPEPTFVRDPYFRFDVAEFRGSLDDAAKQRYTGILTRTLWSSTGVRKLVENWCDARTAPIYVQGSFEGSSFQFDDLCAAPTEVWTGRGAYGGRERFPNYLRLQKNLLRECRQECIH